MFIQRSFWLSLTHAFILLSCTASLSSASDQLALLAFKSMLFDPTGALSSWNNQSSLPLCQWHGVTCGARQYPERVTALELDSAGLAGSISPSLSNLSFLTRLHLADNHLRGPIPEELGLLSRLRYLNLSYNSLEGQIPVSLSYCTSLQNISLNENFLHGSIPANLSNCMDLRVLCLDNNMLVGEIPGEFALLKKLSKLYLASNNLTGTVPSWLSSISSLTHLDLSINSLAGVVLPSLGNLSSLLLLDLSQNNLIGSIPPSLGNCSALLYLGLANNDLEGRIPESLSYLSCLQTFDVSFNLLSGTVPSIVYNLSSLRHLSIGMNQFIGKLPADIGRTLPRLWHLVVQGNWFNGPVPPSLSNATGIELLDLSKNKFSGVVPPSVGQLGNLQHLNLGWNLLKANDAGGWSFLTALSNCTDLRSLILAYNSFTGNWPRQILNLSSQLQTLVLEGNWISGRIPEEIENLASLTKLNLNRNLLTGSIPATIGRLQALQVLRLSRNRFMGQIPASLSNLTQLNELQLGENELQGGIPSSFGNFKNLGLLNLSYNQLSDTIPKEVAGITSLSKLLDLSHNFLQGSIPQTVGRLRNLVQLNVAYNSLSGQIPSSLGDCQILQYLYMESNFFSGLILPEFSKLKGIQELDLSHNNLSGHIPEFLANISTLHFLNLAFNNFEGDVPLYGIFTNVSAFSVEGNDNLCGSDLNLKLPLCSFKASKTRFRFGMLKIILSTTSAVVCLIALPLFAFIYWKRRRSKTCPSMPLLGDQYGKVSHQELLMSTHGFSTESLIGAGSFSSVYKGTIRGHKKEVAVKVLDLQQRGAMECFEAECEILRNIRHRNILKIQTSCSSIDAQGNEFKALVFEFMPNGSVEDWLHPKDCNNSVTRWLSLAERLNIAIDVASALEYLHHQVETPIIHCDIKPSNILLNNDMNALVGDFGLARYVHGSINAYDQDPAYPVMVKGTVGYVAPEYGMGKPVSTHGDVYSYGILLLEMLTGKRPTDDMFRDGLAIQNYCEMMFPERVMEVVDPQMPLAKNLTQGIDGAPQNTLTGLQECLVSMIRIGLTCSKETPGARMDMRSVSTEIKAIRNSFQAALQTMQ